MIMKADVRPSTIDMIFSIRQLQEKSREQRQPLYIAFIDLTKAFDQLSPFARNGESTIIHYRSIFGDA